MSVNYTEEQVNQMVSLYSANPTRETVEKLSEEFDKSIKSIIGKLAREGVYKKTVYKTKTGEDPITKKELVVELSELLGLEYSKIAGLEKAPKADLKLLHSEVKGEYDE
tara:strand:+ start:154 stop:480 length:327 start_codon:yes stop_codon:yes gene_type:complete